MQGRRGESGRAAAERRGEDLEAWAEAPSEQQGPAEGSPGGSWHRDHPRPGPGGSRLEADSGGRPVGQVHGRPGSRLRKGCGAGPRKGWGACAAESPGGAGAGDG